ncbi:uncharacterized mitochondrial protein-like protein [Tanacetum coccineum]
MCDKKNKVLFTDTECLVLSPDFKLPDENQVLLRVPRQNNMYSFNLENIVPTGGLACLIAKATIDESNKWHRRLGHVNFKNLNKLVKGNLVRGLPSKIFQNDHTCVACQKGKQHKASYKLTKLQKVKEANHSAGTQDNIDAGNSETEAEPAQEYFVLPLWSSYTSTIKSSKAKNEDEKPNGNMANDAAEAFRKEFAQCTKDLLCQAGAARVTSTNTINTVSTPISTASPSNVFSAGGPDLNNNDQDDSQIPALEDIYDNPKTTVNVSPIPTSRIHSIHPTTQILRDPTSAVQTRSKVHKSSGAHAFVSYIQKQRRNNHKDFQHCLFACFLSQIEPKKISQALEDESWVDAMQEELLEFKIQKVWILVDWPFGKKAIEIKWDWIIKRKPLTKTLFIKKDKNDIMLVQVYMDDIIFGSTKRSWCDEFEGLMKSKFQISSMGELTFFLGLQVKQKEDGIFISQDKYVAEIMKKFDFASVKTTSTPIETQKSLTKDEEAADVDVHLYRSMIGSLMYLTASRPDIMFVVCACSRFRVTPKTSHLHAVKRIFRYLKGKPKLGLWYPRVSSFDLKAYSDSDYARANLDRKSTTEGCQFLGRRLISEQIQEAGQLGLSLLQRQSMCCCQLQVQFLKLLHCDYAQPIAALVQGRQDGDFRVVVQFVDEFVYSCIG